MKTFHCSNCQNLVFFENFKCLSCQHNLAYLPDELEMAAFLAGEDGTWNHQGRNYRLCGNGQRYQVCNWAIAAEDPQDLCRSCQLTHIIPDLGQAGNQDAWYRLEVAKRRMLYALLAWGLPVARKGPADPSGVQFEFLGDTVRPNGDSSRVLTGHDNGLITINVAEADDVYREQQRTRQNEPYRTVLGHFRHEIGHYYWDRLIAGSPRLGEFRNLFGDETADYQQALNAHYHQGPPPNWSDYFISAYASTHPWEDWAECWAHVMHMIDALETADSLGVSVRPRRQDEPVLDLPQAPVRSGLVDFEELIRAWMSLTYVLNNFTRGLGLRDGYPFVLSEPVIAKLRYVYDTIRASVAAT